MAPAGIEGARSVLVSIDQWRQSDAAAILAAAGVATVWVDCRPGRDSAYWNDVVAALSATADGLTVVPVVPDLDLLEPLLAARRWPVIALKGNEASGFVSSEPTHVLLSIAERSRRLHGAETSFVIWGGVATPEAASAYLATGAVGIVFESVHWLTDRVPLNARVQQSIRSLRPDFTRVVGADRGICCRLFDKGNSRAVRWLLGMTRMPESDEAIPDARQRLLDLITSRWQSALAAGFGADDLIPLGPEASFAGGFADRFGTSSDVALNAFRVEVQALLATAEQRLDAFAGSPASAEWGTGYPIVQGAMSWITDHPDFARELAVAGALPTLALGFRNRAQLEREFPSVVAALGGKPYAVNVIVLPENPLRDEQLAWIEATRPPFVVIAAGDPVFARRLTEKGIRALYVASDEGLLRLALDAGVRWVILEGQEAGGHVGSNSLTTLTQTMHELRRRQPESFEGVRLVMAGAIFDRMSAARAVLLGADAIQMGTAYLAVDEAVRTGALARVYQEQILAARPGGTIILGEAVGLRIRSLRSPKTEALARVERRFGVDGADENVLRRTLEETATGTLLIAARGVRQPGGGRLDEQVCREEGQFMSGTAAGCIDRVSTLAELHREVMTPPALTLPVMAAPAARQSRGVSPAIPARPRERVAITGMAIANAIGNGLDEVWAAVMAGKGGVVAADSDLNRRWDHSRIYDPRPGVPGKTYSRAAAFLNLAIERKDIGIPPQDFRTMAESTKLTLWLARRVLEDSRLLESNVPRERIGVLISQNSGEAASTLRDLTISIEASILAEIVARALKLEDRLAEIEAAIRSGRLAVDDTTLLGRLNCTAGGFVCNQYGFMGPSYSVTAACSTALVALFNAVQLIRAGIADAVLVGGGEEMLMPAHFLEFAAVGALAGMSGRSREPCESSRPFDAERDGMVLGEGGAMIVVERESAARTRGARIHGFVTGVGASNNIHGMVESAAATQRLAIRASFVDAGYGPETVDLVECHATSTTQGDVEEVNALKTFFGKGQGTALASLKSQIGHTLGASGLTSLIRGVMAAQHRTLPPSLNYQNPDPAMDLEGWGFDVSGEPRDWPEPADRPRRFQVNAFGFGGSNYVVQVEENAEERGVVFVSLGGDRETIDVPADVGRHELHGVLLVDVQTPDTRYRAACPETEPQARGAALARLRTLADGRQGDGLFALSRGGMFAAEAGREPARVAFVYPGQGSQYVGMGRDLVATFPEIRNAISRLAAVADFNLERLLFEGNEDELRETRWQQPALFALQFGLQELFQSCGVRPDAVAGHSLGEAAAMCTAGILSWEDGFRLVNKRGQVMSDLSKSGIDGGSMIATDLAIDRLMAKLASRPGVVISNHNSPRQLVLGGDTDQIGSLQKELEAEGCWVRRLSVSMAFHTPRSRVLRAELDAFLETITVHPPVLPIVSNTTRQRFPDDPAAIRQIISSQLDSPVHWRQDVELMSADFGIQVFLELGPKDVLTNLVADTLPGAFVMPSSLKDAEVATCRAALARLAALGRVESAVPPLRLILAEQSAGALAPAGGGVQASPSGVAAGSAGARAIKEESPFVEEVIRLIMEATGYERSEIEADMDIRQDLSIRSSRLPVIIDSAERRFGITVHLEEMIDVRTVRDLAAGLQRMIDRQGGRTSAAPGAGAEAGSAGPARAEAPAAPAVRTRAPLQRLSWREAVVPFEAPASPKLTKGDRVAVVSWTGASPVAREITAWLKRAGAKPFAVAMDGSFDQARDPETLAGAIGSLAGANGPLAGLVLALDDLSGAIAEASSVSDLLVAQFGAVKALVRSADRAFCVAVGPGAVPGDPAAAVSEGVLGLLLTAVQEYSSVLFRHAVVAEATAVGDVMPRILDAGSPIVQLRFDGTSVTTLEAAPRPLPLGPRQLALAKGDVVLVTGGARGITPRLAEALAPFQPQFMLLGRSALTGEIERQIGRFQSAGLEVQYRTCDVSRAGDVVRAVDDAVRTFGRIDGIIHGAAVLRDAFMGLMTATDFAEVAAVKVTALARLYQAARPHGLRFVAGLSTLAAATGNTGQANYTAANRAMAALIRGWAGGADDLRGLTVWLPPIEDVGLASGPEVRDLLRLRGLEGAFAAADEVAALFAEDLVLAPDRSTDSLMVRTLPAVPAVRIDLQPPAERPGPLAMLPSFDRDAFPLVDRVTAVDLADGMVTTERTYSLARDLWLSDHRPLKTHADPILSAVMLIEASLEAAKLAFPHLDVMEVRGAEFLEMLACPADRDLQTETVCRRLSKEPGAACGVSLSPRDAERGLKSMMCQVVMGSGAPDASAGELWLPQDAIDTPPLTRDEIVARYAAWTGLGGRYRVLHAVHGTAPGRVSGDMIYPGQPDFADARQNHYQYSPYVLEAMLQTAHFYHGLRDPNSDRLALPTRIARLAIGRRIAPGERLRIEARLVDERDSGTQWDVRAIDGSGLVVMQLHQLLARWLD